MRKSVKSAAIGSESSDTDAKASGRPSRASDVLTGIVLVLTSWYTLSLLGAVMMIVGAIIFSGDWMIGGTVLISGAAVSRAMRNE